MPDFALARSARLAPTSASAQINADPKLVPAASFTASPTTGAQPLTVTFTNASLFATSYFWQFGDGGTSTATNPTHTYTTAGSFSVTLTATGPGGTSAPFTRTGYITATGTVVVPQDPADITTFLLTDPVGGAAVPFTIGQPFIEGEIANFASPTASVAIIGATAQVTPKNYWPDGSLKFAIISGTAALPANTPTQIVVRRAAASSGAALTLADLKTAMSGQACSISAGAYGTVSWSAAAVPGADFDAPFETWVTGHRMSSWRFRKDFSGDAHLTGWIEVRLYEGSTRQVDVLPWVENSRFRVPNRTSKSATFTFMLGSTVRFSEIIDYPAATRAPLIGTSSKAGGTEVSYWLGATQFDVVVQHERDYLCATELVPSYMIETPALDGNAAALVTSYTPLQKGNFASSGSGVGFSPDIGLLPQHDVLYITTPTLAKAYKAVVFNGYSASRHGLAFRDEAYAPDPNKPIRFLASHNKYTTLATPSTTGDQIAAATGTPAAPWAQSHCPSVGYLAYLLTGRKYHLDDVQFAPNLNCLNTADAKRQYEKGIFDSSRSAVAPRTVAWSNRSLGQAACATPDDDSIRSHYLAQVGHNVEFHWGRYYNQPNNPLGVVTSGPTTVEDVDLGGQLDDEVWIVEAGSTASVLIVSRVDDASSQSVGADVLAGWKVRDPFGNVRTIASSQARVPDNYDWATITLSSAFPSALPEGTALGANDGLFKSSTWMDDYITQSFGYVKGLKLFATGATATQFDQFWSWKAKSIVGRLGGPGSNEWLYRDLTNTYVATAPVDLPNYYTGAGPWFANWGEAYTLNYSGQSTTPSIYPLLSPGPREEGDLRSWHYGGGAAGSSYTASAMPAVAYAVRHAAVGAEEGWRRLSNTSNWWEFQADVVGVPMGAAWPYTMPKWRRGMAIGQVVSITGTSSNSAPPTRASIITLNGLLAVAGGTAVGARLEAYCGATIDTRRAIVWVAAGGGHGDYHGNEVIYLDLRDDSPAWVERWRGSSGEVGIAAMNNYRYGWTLSGCTTSVIRCWVGATGSDVGKTISINGEARVIASADASNYTLTLATPLSTAPAAGVNILSLNPVHRSGTVQSGSTSSTFILGAPVYADDVGRGFIVAGYGWQTIQSVNVGAQTVTIAGTTPFTVGAQWEIGYQPGLQIYGRYGDFQPASRHTYSNTQFVERHGRVISLGGSMSHAGTLHYDTEAFDVEAGVQVNGWDEPGTYPNVFGQTGGGGSIPGSVCRDPVTDCIYVSGDSQVFKHTPNPTGLGMTRTLVYDNPSWNSNRNLPCAVDTRRNQIFYLICGGGVAKVRRLTLSGTPAGAEFSLTGSSEALNVLKNVSSIEGAGICYVPFTDRFYVKLRDAGSVVYVIDPTTFAVSIMTTTGTSFLAQTGSTGQGTYNKWMFDPIHRGIVYIPQSAADVQFLRLY